MYFDYFTAAALIDEFNTVLAGGRIQDIVEIDDLALGFEIYNNHQRHYLYMSADPERARVHLTEGKLRRGMTTPSPLGLLLRRYIEGARIESVHQPPWERIVMFDLVAAEGEYALVVEPIERRANIVLVEAGTIRECIRRVGADENRVRQLLPGQVYMAPPPQAKIDPLHVTLDDLKQALDNDIGAKVPQALTRAIHGLSPLLAREIAFQATGQANPLAADVSAHDLLPVLQRLVQPLIDGVWQPGFTEDAGEITAYSPYQVTHKVGWQPAATMSAALEKFYGAVSGEEAYEAAKKPIRKQVIEARKRLRGKLYSLQQQTRDDREVEALRQSGELILAYQYQMKKGDTLLEAQYDPEGDPLKIKLDPLLNAVDNAKKYFEKYDKAKRSRAAVPEMIATVENDLDYLDQLDADLDIATNWPEIGEVQEALQTAGYWRGQKVKATAGSGKSAPYKVTADDGTLIWVGRNSRQNEQVTFEKGSPEDIWMHARGVPGSHVIVKTFGRRIDEATLRYAAGLAAYYSKARHAGKVEVIVTERKQVRKVKGGKPGMVKVLQETHPSIRATPIPVEQG